jgi:hypothetical protein
MHRDSPFDPYLVQMRNNIEAAKLRVEIDVAMRKDSRRFLRASRFADLVQYLVGDFLPHDRECRRIIHHRLIEAGFAGNCEIINVPLECDELDKLQLERRMLEAKMAPVMIPLSKPQTSEVTDVRWAVNVLLERIAEKFDGWETQDLWRSDAAATVRSFKHDLSSLVSRPESHP